MRKIYKYRLQMVGEQVVPMPKTAKVLSVQEQDGILTVWAMVDPEESDKKLVKFYVVGTGEEILFPVATATFLGSVKTSLARFVWHIFYVE